MELVKEIWLVTNEGNPIAEFCIDKCIEEASVPNLITELKIYIPLLTNVIQTFEFEAYKITFSPALDQYIFIVTISLNSVKTKKLTRLIKEMVKLFESLYDVKDILQWDGDISFFNTFKSRLELYLQMSNL